MKILLSGGTGFLGQYFVSEISSTCDVSLLSRQTGRGVYADLTKWNCGLLQDSHLPEVDVFVHLAGLYDLEVTEGDAHLQNILATRNALQLAKSVKAKLFVHASTVAVTVNQTRPLVGPEDLMLDAKFPDFYSKSKAIAEQSVIRSAHEFEAVLNLRLGILVGSSRGDRIHRIDGPYVVPEQIKKLKDRLGFLPKYLFMPGHLETEIPLVPVDKAAQAIHQMIKRWANERWAGYRSRYLCASRGLNALEYYKSVVKALHLNCDVKLLSGVADRIAEYYAVHLGRFPKEEVHYLLKLPKFDCRETESEIGPNWCPPFHEYEEHFWRGYSLLAGSNKR